MSNTVKYAMQNAALNDQVASLVVDLNAVVPNLQAMSGQLQAALASTDLGSLNTVVTSLIATLNGGIASLQSTFAPQLASLES